jgi:hypothetical protein
MLVSSRGLHFRFQDGQVKLIPRSWRTVWAPALRDYMPQVAQPRTEKYIDASHSARCKRESVGGLQLNPITGTRREATTLCNDYSVAKPAGYYRLFCAHDKAYWCICNMCRRGKDEAAVNWLKLCNRTLY